MRGNAIREKSYSFALDILLLNRQIKRSEEHVLCRQLLKSGTSIGANVEEALAGQSRADFLSKMSIASKEARETGYWLRLLRDSKALDSDTAQVFLDKIDEIIRMLTAIVKTTKSNS